MSHSPAAPHLDGPDPFAPPPAPLGEPDPSDPKALALRAYAVAHSTHPDLLDEHDADHPEVAELARLFEDVVALATGQRFAEGAMACVEDGHGQHRWAAGVDNPYPAMHRRTRALRLDDLVTIVHREPDPDDRDDHGAVGLLLPGHGHERVLLVELFDYYRLGHLPFDTMPVETTLVHDPDNAPAASWSTLEGGAWRAARDGETDQPVTLLTREHVPTSVALRHESPARGRH